MIEYFIGPEHHDQFFITNIRNVMCPPWQSFHYFIAAPFNLDLEFFASLYMPEFHPSPVIMEISRLRVVIMSAACNAGQATK